MTKMQRKPDVGRHNISIYRALTEIRSYDITKRRGAKTSGMEHEK